MSLRISWHDDHRWPQCQPDARYPKGIDLDLTGGEGPICSTPLPYPARRCGKYLIDCDTCGLRVLVTTAGRPDDPRSVKLRCRRPDWPHK